MLDDNVLPTNTRVRLSSGELVPIEDLSGSQGPPGDKCDQGDARTVDAINFYNKLHVDFAILSSRPSAGLSVGAQTYDATTNAIRNILGIGGHRPR